MLSPNKNLTSGSGEGETFHYVLQATHALLTGFDIITRELLNSNTLRRYINEFSVTG
jgi:hypothetical protein